MQVMPVGEFKRHFAHVLDDVRKGGSVGIQYGRRKTPVAVLVPYTQIGKRKHRPLGLLAGQARCVFHDDWPLTEDEFLNSW